MLQKLYIKDFILIEEVNLDFNNGFSVFTGETGAGKSIFIDCVSILIGERMNTSMIRNGTDKAIIQGTFDLTESVREKLVANGYRDDQLVINREISVDGKSVTKLNGKNATVSFIRELMKDYVDIHCQHDNQYLLNDKYHLDLLDSYSKNADDLQELKGLYTDYHKLEKEYDDLLKNEYNEAQLDLLRYQLNEIEKLHLKEGEEEDIQQTLKLYNEKEKLQQSLDKIRDLFDNGILDNLYSFTRISSSLEEYDEIKGNVENINNAYYSLQDDYDAIVSYLGNDEMDVNTVDELNSRLFEIQRIKRKYSSSVKEIISKAEDIRKQLESVDNREEVLTQLRKRTEKAYELFEKKALVVRENRKKKAKELEKEIVRELADLNLEKARFMVEFEETAASTKGLDSIRFLISMNPGQPLRELSTVASGGELSRLMLGLKTIFSKLQGSRLVIFDEIDTGVSGYVAFNIGLKMHDISKSTQVFAVTHLASVAAHGDYHYHISKQDDGISTKTNVELLNAEDRIKEIAVLSTSGISETALKAASELLEKAQSAHD